MTTVERWSLADEARFRNGPTSPAASAPVIPAPDDGHLRIDLFCGLANWSIFLDHIPGNIVNGITMRNFGFSGAADLFVFVSGYAAAVAFARIMRERGFFIGATRVLSHVRRLYAVYIVLFTIYIVVIGYAAAQYAAPDILHQFNVPGLIERPVRTLAYGLTLQSQALNLDVLQLTILLMASLPAVLWLLLHRPGLTLVGSLALYAAARQFDWNLPSFPEGNWHLNPFCWQVLFVLGGWCAVVGAKQLGAVLKAPALMAVAVGYLVFALVVTVAARFPATAALLPASLFEVFNPDGKMNLAPYRLLHFAALAFVVTRWLPAAWTGLRSPWLAPLITCGQHSMAVFCVGVFLSFIGYFVLITHSISLLNQVLVSAAGIAIMTVVAYTLSWSQRQDAATRKS